MSTPTSAAPTQSHPSPQRRVVIGKFQLLAGQHIQKDEAGEGRKYSTGDIVPSRYNLSGRWPEKFRRVSDNAPASPGESLVQKTEDLLTDEFASPLMDYAPPVPDQAQLTADPQAPKGKAPAQGGDPFDSMSLQELKGWATEEGINLGSAKTKEEVVKVLRANVGK